MPDDTADADHSLDFFDLVKTFDAYKMSTSMVDTLQMNVSSMNDLQFTTWLSAFSGNGFPNVQASLLNVKNVTVETMYAASNVDQSPIISDQFVQALVRRLSIPLKTIIEDKDIPVAYLLSMREAFVGLYAAWYTIISKRVFKISSVTIYSAYFPVITVNALLDKANTILDIVESNLNTRFDLSISPDDWFGMACDVINNSTLDVYNQQIMCCCLKPFYIFKYITFFVLMSNDVRTTRYAILSVYMFIFHTVFATYKYSSVNNAFGDDTNNLASILDNVTNLFDSERRAIDLKNQLKVLNLEATSLVKMSKKLKDASGEINLTFANEGTIKQIDENFRTQLQMSSWWKLFWYAAFVVTLILHCLFLTFGGKYHVYAVALSATWLLILSIVLLYRIYA